MAEPSPAWKISVDEYDNLHWYDRRSRMMVAIAAEERERSRDVRVGRVGHIES